MRNFKILLLLITPIITTLFEDGSNNLGKDYELFKQLPKLSPENLQEVIKGFNSVIHLMAIHHAPEGADFTKPGTMERILVETESSEENESFMEKVDGQLIGLKGDIAQSEGLTGKVGEVLESAKGYFDQVKQAKEKLMNPTALVGDAVSGAIGGAVGDITSSFGFRRRLEETEGEDNGKE